MKLEHSIRLANLREVSAPGRRISARALTQEIFRLAEDLGTPIKDSQTSWRQQHLSSKEFVLTDIGTGRVAVPSVQKSIVKQYMRAAADSLPPIVVDLNKHGIGAAPGGYTPKVIVINGGEVHRAVTLQGQGKIKAYVGLRAINYVNAAYTNAIDVCDCKPKVSKLEAAAIVNVPRQDRPDEMQSAPHNPLPKFVQDRGVINSEAATQIQRSNGSGPRTAPSKGGSHSEMQDILSGPAYIKEMHERFNQDVKAGYKPNMSAKAPPGWEGTVKHMKNHSEVSNPFALAWWMKDKGDQSHKVEAAMRACKCGH